MRRNIGDAGDCPCGGTIQTWCDDIGRTTHECNRCYVAPAPIASVTVSRAPARSTNRPKVYRGRAEPAPRQRPARPCPWGCGGVMPRVTGRPLRACPDCLASEQVPT